MRNYFSILNIYIIITIKITSEIKENEIDTSNEEVTHFKFVGDKASDYDHELFVFGENITFLENFLESAYNKQKTFYI